VATLVVGWRLGVPRLEERMRAEARVAAVEVRLLEPPRWLGDEAVRRIEAEAAADLAGDPFDRGELVTVGRVVHASGWFDRVDQVRRTAPDVVEVDATPLTPFAFVRGAGGDRLVDPDGRILPYRLDPAGVRGRREGLAVITGVRAGPPAGIAARWEGAELRAALSLLAMIERHPWREQVATVDASRFLRDGSLTFTTDAGALFQWGSPPGAERPLEPSAERKLEMLDHLHAQAADGRIDGGTALTWWFFEDALTAEPPSG
jgi:hypothetical protein